MALEDSDDDSDFPPLVASATTRTTEEPEEEIIIFLCKVAKKRNIREPNVDSWVTAVKTKLRAININTVKEVLRKIIQLNPKLRRSNQKQMHMHTLDAMANVGVEMLDPSDGYDDEECAMTDD